MVKATAAQIRAALTEKPVHKTMINMLGDFLLTYSPPGLTAEQARARAEAYSVALEDIPSWCLAEAINRWHRGQVDGNLAWPLPATLRKAATDVMAGAEGRAIVMERMLRLEENPEHSEEHRTSMRQRIQALLGWAPRAEQQAAE